MYAAEQKFAKWSYEAKQRLYTKPFENETCNEVLKSTSGNPTEIFLSHGLWWIDSHTMVAPGLHIGSPH